MSNQVSFIVSNSGVINLTVESDVLVIHPSNKNYDEIKEGLGVLPGEKLKALASPAEAVTQLVSTSKEAQGLVVVTDSEVLYDGEPLHNALTAKIISMAEQGFPIEPMLRFLENLMENPSHQSINELYDFLEHQGLPITEDGCFLAYKGIRSDWLDKFSGTIDNSVGQKPVMKRRDVDDNREVGCSSGLHAGTLEYASSYSGERVVQVKINPKHVVSVPQDSRHQKIRVETYEVLSDMTGSLDLMTEPVFQSNGEKWDTYEIEDQFEEADYPDEEEEDLLETDPCLSCPEGQLCNGCEHNH